MPNPPWPPPGSDHARQCRHLGHGAVDLQRPGITDVHSVTYAWGDATVSTGTVSESGKAGSTTAGHTFIRGGTFTVTVTVTDGDGGTASRTFGPVQVNAPAARVGTGSGTFKSPKKSSKAKPTKKGKASFSYYTVSTKPIAGSTTRTPYGSASLTFGKGKVRFARQRGHLVELDHEPGADDGDRKGERQGRLHAHPGRHRRRQGGCGQARPAPDPDHEDGEGGKVVYDNMPGQRATATPTVRLTSGQVIRD